MASESGTKRARRRLVGYVRVSTDRQAEHGFGLDVQERAIREWAKANGHRLVEVFRDEGVSGSNGIEDRDGLPAALLALEAGKADAIVVARLDRLARKLMLQETILADVWRMGAQVFEVGSGLVDPDDEDRVFYRQVMGAVGQLDAAKIRRRLREGRKEKARQGGYAYGSPPFGSRAEGGTLVADPREQATIARIRELVRKGESLRSIARTLEAEDHRPRRSDTWHPETLRLIVGRL